jgi:hypothetical protein
MKYLKYFKINESVIYLSHRDILRISEDLKKLEDNDFYERCDDFNMYVELKIKNRFRDETLIRKKILELFNVKNVKYPTIVDSAFFVLGIYPDCMKVSIYPRYDDWFYVKILWRETMAHPNHTKSITFKCDQEDGLFAFLNSFKSIIDKHNI